MSDLRPRGGTIEIGEEKFRLLFSIKTIDEIQSELNIPIFDAIEVLLKAAKGATDAETIGIYAGVITAIINTNNTKKVTLTEVIEQITPENYSVNAVALMKLFWSGMPEEDDYDPDDEEDEKKESERAVNIARLLYIGCSILGYTEEEVFNMTMRKFYLIYDQYLYAKRIKKHEDINEKDMFRD
ncbi:MAG: hypothetical protein Q4E91_12535 [Lachnospiraceae bacterium]|nr:hypothetical protein [Lachnospiraceae bacterium]